MTKQAKQNAQQFRIPPRSAHEQRQAEERGAGAQAATDLYPHLTAQFEETMAQAAAVEAQKEAIRQRALAADARADAERERENEAKQAALAEAQRQRGLAIETELKATLLRQYLAAGGTERAFLDDWPEIKRQALRERAAALEAEARASQAQLYRAF